MVMQCAVRVIPEAPKDTSREHLPDFFGFPSGLRRPWRCTRIVDAAWECLRLSWASWSAQRALSTEFGTGIVLLSVQSLCPGRCVRDLEDSPGFFVRRGVGQQPIT